MALASHLHMPLGRVLDEVDGWEFELWRAYHAFDPWTRTRGDYQAALVAAVVANTQRNPRLRALRVDEFLLQWGPRELPGEEELEARLLAWAESYNAAMK